MDTPASGGPRLGAAVFVLRELQGLTHDDIAAAGGPSDTTMSKLENGIVERLAPKTFAKLDTALHLAPGTSRAIYRGDPEPKYGWATRIVGGRGHDVHTATEAGGREDTLLFQRPEGITDDEWERVRMQGRAYIDGLLDAAAQER